MFTGLIECGGVVRALEARGDQANLVVSAPFADDLAEGESIAVNGVCLTATRHDQDTAAFDLLGQTLRVTALADLREGSIVNLERALRVGDRLGGHFVLGHVDGIGDITALEAAGQDHRLIVRLPPELVPYCIEKGSMAIDGISLTIAEIEADLATFWIIPHTFTCTNLHTLRPGQRVNLEADILAKHLGKLIER